MNYLADMDGTAAKTSSVSTLFDVNEAAEKLYDRGAWEPISSQRGEAAVFMQEGKARCSDWQPLSSALRVKAPDIDDYKKLSRTMKYLEREHSTCP